MSQPGFLTFLGWDDISVLANFVGWVLPAHLFWEEVASQTLEKMEAYSYGSYGQSPCLIGKSIIYKGASFYNYVKLPGGNPYLEVNHGFEII